jgi:predicted SnoaL-like aldol condensation-catalyzing enzyme
MTPKKLVESFYKHDVFLDADLVASFLHDDVLMDWNSSKGFLQMNKEKIVSICAEMGKAYTRSKIKVSHLIAEGNLVSIRYHHYVNTIENPREEILLAPFIVIWEVKEGKLFRGYQMSHIS